MGSGGDGGVWGRWWGLGNGLVCELFEKSLGLCVCEGAHSAGGLLRLRWENWMMSEFRRELVWCWSRDLTRKFLDPMFI